MSIHAIELAEDHSDSRHLETQSINNIPAIDDLYPPFRLAYRTPIHWYIPHIYHDRAQEVPTETTFRLRNQQNCFHMRCYLVCDKGHIQYGRSSYTKKNINAPGHKQCDETTHRMRWPNRHTQRIQHNSPCHRDVWGNFALFGDVIELRTAQDGKPGWTTSECLRLHMLDCADCTRIWKEEHPQPEVGSGPIDEDSRGSDMRSDTEEIIRGPDFEPPKAETRTQMTYEAADALLSLGSAVKHD